MKYSASFFLFAMAFVLPMTSANAQTVYRCGNSYSQVPCPGGANIETQDERSRSQKAQADAAIKRDSKAADTLEKSRLKQEAATAKSGTSAKSTKSTEKPSPDNSTKPTATQKKKQEYFTAKTASEPKKKTEDEKSK